MASPDDQIEDAELVDEPPALPAPADARPAPSSPPNLFEVARRTVRFGTGITLLATDGVRQLLAQPDEPEADPNRPLPAVPAPDPAPTGIGGLAAATGRFVAELPPVKWARRRAGKEGEVSRTYAKSVLGNAAGAATDIAVAQTKKIDFDRISRDLELSRIVMQSTGGLTGEAIDAVRAQAVGADALIDRIVAKVLRRRVERPPFELDR
jgi:hypothetical protein